LLTKCWAETDTSGTAALANADSDSASGKLHILAAINGSTGPVTATASGEVYKEFVYEDSTYYYMFEFWYHKNAITNEVGGAYCSLTIRAEILKLVSRDSGEVLVSVPHVCVSGDSEAGSYPYLVSFEISCFDIFLYIDSLFFKFSIQFFSYSFCEYFYRKRLAHKFSSSKYKSLFHSFTLGIT
jgi:hypothetical protein